MFGTRALLCGVILLVVGGRGGLASAEILKVFNYGLSAYLLPLNNGSHGDLMYHNDTETFTFTHNNMSHNSSYTSYEIFTIPGPELANLRLSGQRHVTVSENTWEIDIATLDISHHKTLGDYTLFDISQLVDDKSRLSTTIKNCPDTGGDTVLVAFLFQDDGQQELYVLEYFPDDRSPPHVLLATNKFKPIYQEADSTLLANFHIDCVDGSPVLLQLGTEFDEDRKPLQKNVYLYRLEQPSESVNIPEEGIEALAVDETFLSAGRLTLLGTVSGSRFMNLRCTVYDEKSGTLYASGQYLNQRYRFYNSHYLYLLPISLNAGWQLNGVQGDMISPRLMSAGSVEALTYCDFDKRTLKSTLTLSFKNNKTGVCQTHTILATLPLDRITTGNASLTRQASRTNRSSNYEPQICDPDINLMPEVLFGGLGTFITSFTFTTIAIVCWHAKRRLAPAGVTDDTDSGIPLMQSMDPTDD